MDLNINTIYIIIKKIIKIEIIWYIIKSIMFVLAPAKAYTYIVRAQFSMVLSCSLE